MHYEGTAFAIDNTYTIIDRETGKPVGRNEEISRQDFELLNRIYPSEDRCTGTRPYNLKLFESSENKAENESENKSENESEVKVEQQNVQNDIDSIESWILVLNNWYSFNVPLILDGKGQSKEIDFSFESGTEVLYSCSIVWRGEMFVFGGYNYKRQVSVVDQCQLTKKGDLPFDMTYGACAQRDNQEVFICFENYFDSSTNRNCHRSNGPLEAFSSMPSSINDHRQTRIAVTSGKPNLPCQPSLTLKTTSSLLVV